MLFKKMLRDMRRSWGQFLIIFLMAMAGVVVFSGINSVLLGFKSATDDFLKETRFPDYFFEFTPVDENDINQINAIDGVKLAERRAVRSLSYNGISFAIFQSAGTMLRPLVTEGKPFDNNSHGIWMGEKFAQLHNIKPGDTFYIENVPFVVEGLVLSSEYTYLSRSLQNTFTYIYASSENFALLRGAPCNYVALQLDKDANSSEVVKKVLDIAGNRYQAHYSGDNHESVLQVNEKTQMLSIFSYIYPVLFLALALMTMGTTMSRLINAQRTQIGTLMALGYSRTSLKLHYISYGLWLGIAGGLGGLFLGRLIIPPILKPLFDEYFLIPEWSVPISPYSVIAVGLTAVLCALISLISVGKKLSASPSEVLKEREVKSSRRSVFEKIPPLWKRLSFESKVTLRNISKNRKRAIMGFVGIAAGMMLVLSGLGMKNSIAYTHDFNLDKVFTYDYILHTNYRLDPTELNTEYQFFFQDHYVYTHNGETMMLSFTIFDEGNLLNLNDGKDISNDGLIITKAYAEVLDKKVGDVLNIGFRGSGFKEMKIAQIVDIPVMRDIFISRAAWESYGLQFRVAAVWTGDLDVAAWQNDPRIAQIQSKNEVKERVASASKLTDAVVYVSIAGAIFLSVVVLINLGILSYSEMKRQYAILKVIGFRSGELRKMSFLENMIVSAVGWLTGIPCGIWFLNVFLKLLGGDTSIYWPHITAQSYIFATLITLGCALATNFLQGLKIRKLDLVNTLKAFEQSS